MNTRRPVPRAVGALIAAGSVGAFVSFGGLGGGVPAASAATYVSFQSPTGNAHCYISTEPGETHFAGCELREYSGKVPPRPADCELDWVPGASMNGAGRVFLFGCQGDTTVNPDNPKLAYGKTIRSGEFTCTSAVTGITCKVKSGRGFLVSKAAIRKL